VRRELGSIREQSPGVFRLTVSVGYNSATGKRRRATRVVRGSEREAELVLARMLLESGRLPETEVSVRSFLVDLYLPHLEKRRRRRKTLAGYRSMIEHHIEEPLGDLAVSALVPYQLQRWMDELSRVHGEGELSERSRLHIYIFLKGALRQAVVWGLRETNPMEGVARPELPRRAKKDVLTAKEAGAYLAAFRGNVIEPVVVLALACGLRRCELAGLRWSDIDFEAGKLEVLRGLHDFEGEVIEEEPKSENSRRRISVPAWALEALRPLRGLGPLVSEDGGPMKPCHITQHYCRQVKEAGLRHVSLKNIRHSHACLLIEAGVDLYTVSRRLGHATTAVTELHYVDPSEKADEAAADALGDLRRLAPGVEN
jgi:integrase